MPAPRRTAGARGARPGLPGLPGLPSPAARSGRGSSSPQSLLPPDRGPPGSWEHRAHGPLESRPRDREVPELGAALVSLLPGDGLRGYLQPPGSLDPASSCSYRGLGRRPEPAELRKVPVDRLLPPAHCRRLGWLCERVRGFSPPTPRGASALVPYLRQHIRGCQLILPLPRPPISRSPPSISLLPSCQKSSKAKMDMSEQVRIRPSACALGGGW